MDVSYIPMARGFIYLAAVVNSFSRRILASRLSITMETSFCIEAVEEALTRYVKPEVFNTDQGSQLRGPHGQVLVRGVEFTSEAFTQQLKNNDIAISMDGRGSGATMSSWNESGGRSSTKRSIYTPTRRSMKREPPCGVTSISITP